jgi:Holliday junction resolvasome RuvABC endonuclease subunit
LRDPSPGGVLCFDLASHVGWAYGHLANKLPEAGVWHLPKIGGEGARYAAFNDLLYATLKLLAPSEIVIESALPPLAQTRTETAHQQYKLRGDVKEAGWRRSIAVSEISALTVRMEVMGKAHFPDKTVKTEVVRFCRDLGMDITSHDAADAVLIWLWHRRRLRGFRGRATPLFRDQEFAATY